jgi:hypothetical protein
MDRFGRPYERHIPYGDGRSWLVSHDAAHSLTCSCGMPSPRSREESAAAIPEICHSLSSRYAEIASVARNERERPVERAIFSRRFFSAFLTRMVMVAVRGVSIMSYIVSQAAKHAMKEAAAGFYAAKIGGRGHGNWRRGACGLDVEWLTDFGRGA